MGFFSVKPTKPRPEPKKDSYYIEPTEPNPEEESNKEWFEQEKQK